MNIFNTLLFLVLVTITGFTQEKQIKRYEIKSGIIEYKTTVSGKIMGMTSAGSGIEKLYFKNWGALELVEVESKTTTHTKLFGKESTDESNVHTMSKLDNGKSYHVDFKQRKILLRRDIAMESIKEYNDGDAHQTGENMLEAIGGQKIGEEVFMNYKCEVWTAMGTKMWIYKGIPLKSEANIMGIKTLKVAVKVKLNSEVSDSYFKLPDFPIVNADGYTTDAEYNQEKEEMKANAKAMENMTYEEYKTMVIKDDPEAKEMSEQEMRQGYSLFKFMIKQANK